jgi:RNA 3'-terminal phosphate cyclase
LAPRSKLGSSNWPLACSVFKGKTVKITALRLWRRDPGLELLCWCVLMCAGVCWCHLHVSAVVPRVRSAVSG